MELVTEQSVAEYMQDDVINKLLDTESTADHEKLTCQKWLRDSAPKRMIFNRLYGDLLRQQTGLRVLDIGGGLTAFTDTLAKRHEYHLIDLLAHDHSWAEENDMYSLNQLHLHKIDWHDFSLSERFDVIIANDLFPNVDQRLDMVIQKFLPFTSEMRLSLTYYPRPRFYVTKRIDADEVLCMLAWDGTATRNTLQKYSRNLYSPNFDLFSSESDSVYSNDRQVCIVKFQNLAGNN